MRRPEPGNAVYIIYGYYPGLRSPHRVFLRSLRENRSFFEKKRKPCLSPHARGFLFYVLILYGVRVFEILRFFMKTPAVIAPITDAKTMRKGRRLEDERIGGCAPWEPIADADSIAVKPAEAADRRTEVHSIRRRLPSSNGWPPCSRRRMIQILNFVSGQNTQRRNFSHQILCALSTIILKAYRFLEGCTSSVLS